MKRFLVLSVVLMLSISMFGCANKKTDNKETQTQTETTTEKLTEMPVYNNVESDEELGQIVEYCYYNEEFCLDVYANKDFEVNQEVTLYSDKTNIQTKIVKIFSKNETVKKIKKGQQSYIVLDTNVNEKTFDDKNIHIK